MFISIKAKLYLIAVIGAFALIIFTLINVITARHGSQTLAFVYEQQVEPTAALRDMEAALKEVHFRMAGYLLRQMPAVGNRNHLQEARSQIPKAWQRFKEGAEKNLHVAEAQALIDTIDGNIGAIGPFFDKLDAAYTQDDRQALTPLLEDEWPLAIQATILKPITKLVPMQRAAVRAAYQDTADFNRKMMIAVIAILGTTTTLLIAAIVRLTTGITRPLGAAVSTADKIAEGDWGSPIDTGRSDEFGQLLRAIGHMRDQVHARQTRLETILGNAAEGIITFDENGKVEGFNHAAERLFGYAEKEIIGKDIGYLIPPPHAAENRKDYLKHLLRVEIAQLIGHEGEVIGRNSRGETFPMAMKISRMQLEGREMYTALVADISERKQLIENLKRLAEHDGLTGLYNRTYFLDELDRTVERVKRTQQSCAILYIDLDNFKYVNDTLGHAAGDRLLAEVAVVLAKRARKSDLIARLGGDEFTVLLHNVTDEQAAQAAESFRQLLVDYRFTQSAETADIGCSIGLVLITPQNSDARRVLAQADIACHLAKRGGRNRVHRFDPADAENISAMSLDMGWSRRIREAIDQDRFVLAFQPIVHAATKSPEWYEVLLRLRTENGDLIMPNAFLPTAERFGLAAEIDKWVIAHAIEELAARCRQQPDLRYSINLSAHSLADVSVCDLIQKKIEETGIVPSALMFEVTETAAIADLAAAEVFLGKVRAIGCRTALDDFGSGMSSFAYLRELPVDCLKIDGRFVRNIARNPVDHSMVKAMNDIAHAMGKRTIAEFVENEEGLRVLVDLEIDYCQGYHLGRPEIGVREKS